MSSFAVNPVNVLKAGRSNLYSPHRFIQGKLGNGSAVTGTYGGGSVGPGANKFCAIGALYRVNFKRNQGADAYAKAENFLHSAASQLYGIGSVIGVNDDTSIKPDEAYRRVLRVYNKAIKLAEAAA